MKKNVTMLLDHIERQMEKYSCLVNNVIFVRKFSVYNLFPNFYPIFIKFCYLHLTYFLHTNRHDIHKRDSAYIQWAASLWGRYPQYCGTKLMQQTILWRHRRGDCAVLLPYCCHKNLISLSVNIYWKPTVFSGILLNVMCKVCMNTFHYRRK